MLQKTTTCKRERLAIEFDVNPGYTRGITVGSAKDGSLRAFIPDPDLAQAT